MKKWEYKTINQKSRINLSQLNELGSEGWELVNTISVPNTGSYTLIFKRELEDETILQMLSLSNDIQFDPKDSSTI